MSSWNGLVGRRAIGSDDRNDPGFASRDSVAFHGLAVNALFRLGGDS